MITHALGYQTKLPPKAIRETDLYAELKLTEIFRRPSTTGIWYDPQDLATLFQDAQGTLPVYRPGTGLVDPPVGLMMDKSGGGYHASQNTPTARPPLSGRYNLLTATETLSTQSVTTVATNYTLSFSGTGTITLSGTATGTLSAGTHTITCTAGTLTCTVAGSVTKADLRAANDGVGLPPYQRVDSATTYDTAGFPLYLRFDGVDDFLQTANVDLTGTDEITIGAGSQRFGGVQYNRVYEFSVDAGLTAGSFVMMSPDIHSNNNFLFNSRGSASSPGFSSTGNTVGSKHVSIYSSKISTDFKSLTIDGGNPSTLTADSGAGPFGNYPLFVGARGAGPAYFFNGRIYRLCIIGSLLSTSEQAVLERYINAKTRAY